MARVAIVGGGLGGLLTASLLEEFCADLCGVTLFEAGPRLGGKVLTERFTTAPVSYEAGVAELYDYSHFGPDPIRQLVKKLGLSTVRMRGPTVVLGDAVLSNARDIRRHFGADTLQALRAFQQRCRDLCPPAEYYEGHWQDDNRHPWADKTFREVLDEIPDEIARKYVEVAVRSDVATEPHRTTALNGLKNVLMDDPRYLRLYSIEGGIGRLVDRLAQTVRGEVVLESPIVCVGKNADGTYRLTARRQGRFEEYDFDLVVLALPSYWLGRVEWAGRELRLAMQKHLAHYDHPAHYLRVSVLFREPFWRDRVPGSYFMLDAFGGCCVYDEGSRYPCDPYGVLGWLLAGNDALSLSNLDDARLIDLALDSLPEPLARGREMFLEGRVHRWVGSVSGLPGGNPTYETRARHLPEPEHHSGLFLVGDYLFDSTINGVYDSADFVTDMILTRLRQEKYISSVATAPVIANGSAVHKTNGHCGAGPHIGFNGALEHSYHDHYDGERRYEECFEDCFSLEWTVELIRAVWGWSPPYQLLDCGSANGLTLDAFAGAGIDAWGVENSAHIQQRTPARWKKRNLLGDVRDLPFADNSFDFVYDTCLCYVPTEDLDRAVRELLRVCRVGVFFGGVTSDMTREVIEDYNLFRGVRSLFTLWEWSEIFLRNGFRMAVTDPKVLARAWQIESEIDEDDWYWYPDAESMRYCFYSRPDAPLTSPKRKRGTFPRLRFGLVEKSPVKLTP
jgi:monoamine oxidase/SAM-dependent methyltransferase